MMRRVGRMARSPQRYVALVAMLALAVAVGFGVLITWFVLASGDDDGIAGAGEWQAIAALLAGLAATLAAIAGLTVGSRSLAAVAVLAQAGVAAWIAVLLYAEDWVDGEDAVLLVLAFGAVVVADLLALSAVVMPPQPVPEPEPVLPTRDATPGLRKAALAAMAAIAFVSLVVLAIVPFETGPGAGFESGLTGGVGLGGALVCLLALWRYRPSVAGGAAVSQAVLVGLLFLWFGRTSWYGAVHVGVAIADAMTLWAAVGSGVRTPRSAAPRPRAQG